MNEKLNNQNSNLIKNIEENKNRWAEYQIDIQSVINKINSENKLELKKLRNEFLENLEVKITDKFYELTDESKNNKNNQNSCFVFYIRRKILVIINHWFLFLFHRLGIIFAYYLM